MKPNHTRNVAGHKLTQVTRAVYEQQLGNGKRRWFVRTGFKGEKKDYWRYTKTFKEKPEYVMNKLFETLTDAVIAANKKK